jgi:hypothetical protein
VVAKRLDRAELVADELKRCTAFLDSQRKHKRAVISLNFNMQKFVEATFDIHRNLIERWGGWMYHGQPSPVALSPDEKVGRLDVIWRNAASDMQRLGWALKLIPWKNEVGAVAGSSYNPLLLDKALPLTALGHVYDHISLGSVTVPFSDEEKAQFIRDAQLDKYYSPEQIKNYAFPATVEKHILSKCRAGQRIASVIMDALDRGEISAEKRKVWEKMLQAIGEKVWSATTTSIGVSLSVAPSHFLKLGHYGEGNSCYQNGGSAQYSKLFLATDVPDSFVALFYKPRTGKTEIKISHRTGRAIAKVAGRAWGIAVPELGAMLTNFYLLGQSQVGGAVTQVLKDAIGLPDDISTIQGVHEAARDTKVADIQKGLASGLYLNSDFIFLTPKESVKSTSMKTYLKDALDYAAQFGMFAAKGNGPNYAITKWADPLIKPSKWPYEPLVPRAKSLFDSAGNLKR